MRAENSTLFLWMEEIQLNDLLSQYSISEIIVFIVALVIAVKEFIQLYDWFKVRIKQHFDVEYAEKDEHAKLENKIEELTELRADRKRFDNALAAINETLAKTNERIDMLIDSDKESIKFEITRQHHYFVKEKGWIDYHSMDCLEKRFAIYEKEHGNSFAKDLMDELRALPKHPSCNNDDAFAG